MKSFVYEGAQLYNKLPKDIKGTISLTMFKKDNINIFNICVTEPAVKWWLKWVCKSKTSLATLQDRGTCLSFLNLPT